MNAICLEALTRPAVEGQRVELVERKGKGHPDTICDAVAESVSLALCREYKAAFGRILHHNADKGMLVAGQTLPRLGGGRVVEPMRLARLTANAVDGTVDVAGVRIVWVEIDIDIDTDEYDQLIEVVTAIKGPGDYPLDSPGA